MQKINYTLVILAVLFLLFPSVSLQAMDPTERLDAICQSALAGSTDVEISVQQYAKSYLTGVITISSSTEISKMKKASTLYIIAGVIDFKGRTITIPKGSVLFFRKGAQFRNGTMIGDDTRIVAPNQVVFPKGASTYRGYLKGSTYSYMTNRKGALVVSGTWSNKVVGGKWTELNANAEKECQSLSLNNLISLFSREVVAEVPRGNYYIYDWIRIMNRSVDFNGSQLLSIDFNRVENRSIKLPSGSKSTSLRSRYGLIDFNGVGKTLKNVTVDGRASSRNEKPKLGSECLITIADGSDGGIFENVVTKDAVDCDVCTGAIKGFTFRNVVFGPCGEHGFYTHAYAGELLFEDCVFDGCGQSPDLFTQRGGVSGCVRGAASRDRKAKEYAGLKAVFKNCTFSNSGNINVVTLYTDIPKADFYRCKWIGKVGGYVANNPSFNEEAGQMYEYSFIECDNPCGKHNAKNTIRKLIGCKNVRNPFEDTYWVENCDIIVAYDDVDNRYEGRFASEVNRPVVFTNCSFRKSSSEGGIRSNIINPRPMSFISCSWDVSAVQTKERGQSLIFLKDKNGRVVSANKVIFQDCRFNLPDCRLITCCDTNISFQGGEYVNSYDVLILGDSNRPNKVESKKFRNSGRKQISRY